MIMLNYLLDKSVVFSFDRSGYERHSRTFLDLPARREPETVIITGGTSGIGKACADYLLEQGNHCIVTGRDPAKFESRDGLESSVLDLSNWSAVSEFAHGLGSIDHLVLNAGGMPEHYALNATGCEYQAASQLLGHLLLFETLHRNGKLQQASKIVFVSSGGMLLKKLDVNTLFQTDSYDKVDQYANVKRAQVMMTEVYAERYPQYHFSAMHPGWVATWALEESLPGFFSFFKKRLRTHHQGADSILWLLYTHGLVSGRFWFDRKEARSHPLPITRSGVEDRNELIDRVDKYIAAVL